MSPHSSTNFEIQEHDQNKPKFNGVYSIDSLSKTKFNEKIKDGAYVINRHYSFDF